MAFLNELRHRPTLCKHIYLVIHRKMLPLMIHHWLVLQLTLSLCLKSSPYCGGQSIYFFVLNEENWKVSELENVKIRKC